jgi:hypothetical protein
MELLDMRNDMATMRKTLSDKRWNAQPIFSVKTKKTAPCVSGAKHRRWTSVCQLSGQRRGMLQAKVQPQASQSKIREFPERFRCGA